ncbi:hypothetical protein OG21DRAFT_1252351 [Imleria badia]|nr:hypothetical protein OG21DRAFT_1252351 [Imleria badia]
MPIKPFRMQLPLHLTLSTLVDLHLNGKVKDLTDPLSMCLAGRTNSFRNLEELIPTRWCVYKRVQYLRCLGCGMSMAWCRPGIQATKSGMHSLTSCMGLSTHSGGSPLRCPFALKTFHPSTHISTARTEKSITMKIYS